MSSDEADGATGDSDSGMGGEARATMTTAEDVFGTLCDSVVWAACRCHSDVNSISLYIPYLP